MLHSSLLLPWVGLVPALVAPAQEAPSRALLLDRLAPDYGVLLSIGDIRGLAASDDPGMFVAMLKSERMREFGNALMESEGAPAGLYEGVANMMTGLEGLVAGIDPVDGEFVAVAWGADDLGARVCTALTVAGYTLEAADGLGAGAQRALTAAGDTSFEFVMDGGGAGGRQRLLVARADDSAAAFARLRSASGGEDPSPGWWRRESARVANAFAEGFVRIESLPLPEGSTRDTALQMVRTGYVGTTALNRASYDGLIALDFGPHPAVARLASAVQPIPRDLLTLPPDGLMSATFISLDLPKLFDAAKAIVDALSDHEPIPEGKIGLGGSGRHMSPFDSFAELASGSLGLDVRDELLPSFDGTFVVFEWPEESAVSAALDEDIDEVDVLEFEGDVAPFPTFYAGVRDGEGVMSLIETLETFVPAEYEELESGERWAFDLGLGEALAVELSDAGLLVGPVGRVDELRARLASGPEHRAADALVPAAAIEAIASDETLFGATLQSLETTLDSMSLMLDSLMFAGSSAEEAELAYGLVGELMDVMEDAPDLTLGTWSITAKRLVLRWRPQ